MQSFLKREIKDPEINIFSKFKPERNILLSLSIDSWYNCIGKISFFKGLSVLSKACLIFMTMGLLLARGLKCEAGRRPFFHEVGNEMAFRMAFRSSPFGFPPHFSVGLSIKMPKLASGLFYVPTIQIESVKLRQATTARWIGCVMHALIWKGVFMFVVKKKKLHIKSNISRFSHSELVIFFDREYSVNERS